MNAGYSVSLSHAANNSLKTDAPASVILVTSVSNLELIPLMPSY